MTLPNNLSASELVSIANFLKPILKAVSFDAEIKGMLVGKDFNARLEAVLSDESLIAKAHASYEKAMVQIEKARDNKKELNKNYKQALSIARFVQSGRSNIQEVTAKYGQSMAGLVQYHLATTLA